MKTLLVLLLLLAGCASYRPIIDTRGVNMQAYENDLANCQAYASQISPGANAAGTAAAGAVIGGILGGLFGNRQSVGQMAAAGGMLGGVSGAEHGANQQMNVIRNCLRGRGYQVLQ